MDDSMYQPKRETNNFPLTSKFFLKTLKILFLINFSGWQLPLLNHEFGGQRPNRVGANPQLRRNLREIRSDLGQGLVDSFRYWDWNLPARLQIYADKWQVRVELPIRVRFSDEWCLRMAKDLLAADVPRFLGPRCSLRVRHHPCPNPAGKAHAICSNFQS